MSNARNLANLLGTGTTVPSSKLSLVSSDMPTGTVLQVKQTYVTTAASYSGTHSSPAATASTASITPSSTSSKILIMIDAAFSSPGINHNHQFLKRTIGSTTTDVGQATSTSNRPASTGIQSSQVSNLETDNENYDINHSTVQFLDSPATTSEVTYKLHVGSYSASTIYLNRTRSDRDNTGGYDARMTSSVLLMEIAG